MLLQANFFKFPLRGNLGKLEPVREHRQCLLFFTEKVPAFSAMPNRESITLSTINIRNSGERKWEDVRPCIPAAKGD